MERVWDWEEEGGKDAGAERMFWGVSGLLRGCGEERGGDNEQQPRTGVRVGQGRRVVKTVHLWGTQPVDPLKEDLYPL